MRGPAAVTDGRIGRALGRVPRSPGVRLVAGLLAALALVGMVVAYVRATSTIAETAETCRTQPAACRSAAEAGESRVVDSGPRVLGGTPDGDTTSPAPASGRVVVPGSVTTLPPAPERTIVAPPPPPITVERTVVRESTVAGTPTRVTETVTEAAPPPATVTVERTETQTQTVTVTAEPTSSAEPEPPPAPGPTALAPPTRWLRGWWPWG